MLEEKVKELLEKALKERPELFLIDLFVLDDNQIKVVIDGDNNILVEDCMFISRAIEHNLNRDDQDFSLEVTSAGATSPLQLKRQYKKNIGRILNVRTSSNVFEGKLMETDDEGISLTWKTRERKPVGKGKVTVQKQEKIAYNDILEAKVMLKF
ncbi:MAG: ribosome assembly cofactor RimP [Flavobacteriaceae bacterium]|nr:ribosome assembly cofactor RimP [Flavobacteriaceae bacterium]